MRKQLLRKVNVLDIELDDLFEKLNQFDDKALAHKPAPGVWSPVQILQHLLLSESLSLAYVKKKLSYHPKIAKAGLSSQIRSILLYWALRSPMRFTAARGTEVHDQTDRIFSTLKTDWVDHRGDLRTYIMDLSEHWMDKEVYKHPYVGRLSFAQMLDFFQTHFRHHRRQIFTRLPK